MTEGKFSSGIYVKRRPYISYTFTSTPIKIIAILHDEESEREKQAKASGEKEQKLTKKRFFPLPERKRLLRRMMTKETQFIGCELTNIWGVIY